MDLQCMNSKFICKRFESYGKNRTCKNINHYIDNKHKKGF